MRRLWLALIPLLAPVAAALAQTGGTGSVNTPPGWVWTYLGATYGAGWAPPSSTPPSVANFGAVCSGTSDDTAALQAAAAASGTGTVGPILLLPGKTCTFNRQIHFTNTNSPGFFCLVPGYCTLNWTGAATETPLLFASSNAPFGASEIIQFTGGAGYAANDTVTLNDGCATHAVITIAVVVGGAPSSARISNMGSCATLPAFHLTQLSSSGGGTGMAFDMAYGSLGTQINYPILNGVVLTSSTTMSENAFVREIFVYQAVLNQTRLFGNNTVWQGFSFQRAQYTEITDVRIDHLLEQSILVGGTDQSLNANIGTHLRNVIFAGCNASITTKTIAHFKGCLRIGDNVGGIFLDDKVEAFSFNGYAVYFAPTLNHGGGNNLSSLAYFNGLNVEGSGAFSGSIGGGNWSNLTIGGPACWLTGSNLDVLDFYTTELDDIRIDCQIHPSQNDGSTPVGINFAGTGLMVTGSEISGYTGGTWGINLGTNAADVSVTGTFISNLATGINGTTNSGGIKTLANVNFRNNTNDLAGINCGDLQIAWTAGVSSLGKPLCPGNITSVVTSSRDLTAASGTQTITGLAAPSGFAFIPSTCSFFGSASLANNYTTLGGRADNAGKQTALFQNAAGINLSPVSTAVLMATDATGANYQQARVTGYAEGSVTLTWTKTGTPGPGTFNFSVSCSQ